MLVPSSFLESNYEHVRGGGRRMRKRRRRRRRRRKRRRKRKKRLTENPCLFSSCCMSTCHVHKSTGQVISFLASPTKNSTLFLFFWASQISTARPRKCVRVC